MIGMAVPRMAFGRVCMVGDAAFVLRPHPGAATAKAAADATTLAAALTEYPNDLQGALRAWDAQQIEFGKILADQAISTGKRSVEQRHRSWTVADLAERFEGISPVRLGK